MNFIALYYLLNATLRAQTIIDKTVFGEGNSITAVSEIIKFEQIVVQWLFRWFDVMQGEFQDRSDQNWRYFEWER